MAWMPAFSRGSLKKDTDPGAWHGPDMKASLDDVSAELAFWRVAPDRRNIAEITLHHAYSARYVRGVLSGSQPESFVMEGEDWFPLSGDTLSWPTIREPGHRAEAADKHCRRNCCGASQTDIRGCAMP